MLERFFAPDDGGFRWGTQHGQYSSCCATTYCSQTVLNFHFERHASVFLVAPLACA